MTFPFIESSLSFVDFSGRWVFSPDRAEACVPACGFHFHFKGSSAYAKIKGKARWKLIIDGTRESELNTEEEGYYGLASGLTFGEHYVELWKKTESQESPVTLFSTGSKDGQLSKVKSSEFFPLKIEFIGDSYTVGYGNEAKNPYEGDPFSTTDATQSYAFLAAKELRADFQVNAYSGKGIVKNFEGNDPHWTIRELYRYSLGSLAPQGKMSVWDLNCWHPDVICIFAGINDFQGEGPHPTPEKFDFAYKSFLETLRMAHHQPKFILISTRIYPDDLLSERIEAITEKELSEGLSGFSHLFMNTDENSGLCFHPGLNRHKKMARILLDEIKKISL
ncbi:MAG: GDSL-type esterase/lipase family protein [Fibrobacteraceae bacterium]|nr:GDSL-type esterase/lipase family protein [Fibrobacteraceae bacterium]